MQTSARRRTRTLVALAAAQRAQIPDVQCVTPTVAADREAWQAVLALACSINFEIERALEEHSEDGDFDAVSIPDLLWHLGIHGDDRRALCHLPERCAFATLTRLGWRGGKDQMGRRVYLRPSLQIRTLSALRQPMVARVQKQSLNKIRLTTTELHQRRHGNVQEVTTVAAPSM